MGDGIKMESGFHENAPIYLQILQKFYLRIVGGEWPPGARIQSVRELALTFQVNPNTVQKALAELERQELAYSERTSGRFVTQDELRIKALREQLIREQIKDFVHKMREIKCEESTWLKWLMEETNRGGKKDELN